MADFDKNPFAQKYKANLMNKRGAHKHSKSKAIHSAKNMEDRRKIKTRERLDK